MEKPIHVCFVIDGWTVARAGTELQMFMLLKHLDRKRIKPHLAVLKSAKNTQSVDEIKDLEFLQLGFERMTPLSIFSVKKVQEFRRFLKENRIDVIQAYFPDSTYFASIIGKLSGVKLIFGARRNIGHWMKPKDKRKARFLNRFFIDKIVANAHACKRAVIEQENAKPENVFVIPNGIETERFDSIANWMQENANSPKKIGAVGNLKPVKGTDILIQAAKIVLQKHPQTQFEIAGDGDFEFYNQMIQEVGITNNFKLLGSLSDVPDFLQTLDLAVLPSRAEGLSNGLLEYMAAGRPCVATDVGGNGELIENERNGLLVPSENPQALAGAMLDLLDHPDRAEKFAQAARDDIREQFNADVVAEKFAELCEKCLSIVSEPRP